MNWPLNHFVDHEVGLNGQKSSGIKKSQKSRLLESNFRMLSKSENKLESCIRKKGLAAG